jgi:DNA adenine methylase
MNITKKELFLKSISSDHSELNKYKRVSLSPIRYPGGKSLAVGYIIEKLPDDVVKVVSPFFGGGSVELAMNRYLDIQIKGFDIFDILVNYWNYQINDSNLLYERLLELKPDKETFDFVRGELKKHWKNVIKLNPEDLAIYYFYNFSLSYGPSFLGWSSKIYLDEGRYKKVIEKVKNFSVHNFSVDCASFEKVLKKYSNEFLYLDPPYYIGDDSKMFKGIYPMRNEPIHHNGFDHEKLNELLHKHKGGFILSYNDCPTIRNWYKEYDQSFPSWQYTMGQGETRIGKNRIDKSIDHIKKSHEILICSGCDV